MAKPIRLFVTGFKQDATVLLRNGFLRCLGVDMVIAVDKPSEAENKIDRRAVNVILIDLDGVNPDFLKLNAMQLRYGVMMLYTTFSRAKISALPIGVNSQYIQKPVVFNAQTIPGFINLALKSFDAFEMQKTTTLISTREMGLVSNGDKKVVAIASSTGGTSALEEILRDLPADSPPLVVVQHMPSGFTRLFADRINALYRINIKEAQTGDILKRGHMLLAPADMHMKLVRRSNMLAVECFCGVKIHGVMPAADVLFESVAELVKANAIGVILTGMGADGGRGLMLMHNAGAKTIGQNKETCIVYGMPKIAKDLGAVDFELPLGKIAEKVLELANEQA